MKRLVTMMMALMLLCSILLPANAADKGSIEVKIKYGETKVNGGKLTAIRVGYPDFEKNVYRKFKTHSEITGIGNTDTPSAMWNYYLAYKSTVVFDVYKADIKDGIAKFSDLPLGLYLIHQEESEKSSGFKPLSKFLVTVPYDGKLDVSIASKKALERGTDPTGNSGGSGSSGNKLPQTGQLTWPIPMMAVSGMTLFAVGWWLCFGRKEDS